jgi:fructosamine-3-kinase
MLRSQLELILQKQLGSDLNITRFEAAAGGCINECYRLHTSKGDFFLKANRSPYAADMFEKELKGLNTLRETNLFHIPEVMIQGSVEDWNFLLMEYIPVNHPSDKAWHFAGKQVAALHCIHSARYGLHYDNYIGRLPQKNQPHDTFHDFFINERLKPLVSMGKKKICLAMM